MAFDPDKYLAQTKAPKFDPNVYLGLPPDERGNIINTDVPTVAGQVANPPVVEPKRTMIDYVKSLYEVPATMVTGAAAPFLGVGKGIVQNIQQGTNQRVDRPELAQQFQYQPTSPVSQDVLQNIYIALCFCLMCPKQL